MKKTPSTRRPSVPDTNESLLSTQTHPTGQLAHPRTHRKINDEIIEMAIAPITGKLRKRFWLDLSVALGLGVSAGYAFWYVGEALLSISFRLSYAQVIL